MPRGKGQKRKREEEEDTEPLRRSSRQRKRTSYGEDFVEVWSPPKGNGGKEPQPSTSAGTTMQEPEPPSNTVTWPSDVEHYGKELPLNHRKRLYFIRKWWSFNGQRSS